MTSSNTDRKLASLALFRTVIELFIVAHLVFAIGAPAYDPSANLINLPGQTADFALGIAGFLLVGIIIQRWSRRAGACMIVASMTAYAYLIVAIALTRFGHHLSLIALYCSFAILATCTAGITAFLECGA